MNIREAKEEIMHTLRAYLQKDDGGSYTFPQVKQRPILLMGPPGIGKTAIMEQVAQECGVGLVAYTITHHTRQSAIGLPKIVTRKYGDEEFSVTEYTLSEIIASVYDCMERTGKREGILFIDEINCVSETLAPTMLQFLQNKTFGSHRVPKGWVIAAAGNPPEYNKSVREFDIVTLDRVRRIDLEPHLAVWMEYAWKQEVHGAILSYLSVKKEHFYVVENGADTKQFVTARGWEDLSELLKSYESLGVPVGESLMLQYLQKKEVAASFAVSYQLYRKYGTDYGIAGLLDGTIAAGTEWYEAKVRMARQAAFDERLTVVGLLLDALGASFSEYGRTDAVTVRLHAVLQQFQSVLRQKKDIGSLTDFIEAERGRLAVKRSMELLVGREAEQEEEVLRILNRYDTIVREEHRSGAEEVFDRIRGLFQELVQQRAGQIAAIRERLSRAFCFAADCFGKEQEMLLLVTGLTRNQRAMEFICAHGCREYLAYSEGLLAEDREELLQECRKAMETKS